MERSNKLVKKDLGKACQEIEAGLSKGKALLAKRAWDFQILKLHTMSNAVFKL
jgi:hypothetical protein